MRRIREALARMGGKSSKPTPPTVPDKDKRVQYLRDGLHTQQPAHRVGSTPALSRSHTVSNGNRRSLAVDLDPNGPGALILYDGTRDHRGLSTSNTNTTTATEASLASSSSGGKDKGIDIILVHGAGGGRTKTWSSDNGVCWPRDLLPRDLPPNTRVISWGWKVPDNIASADDTTSYGELCNMVSDQLSMDLARLDAEAERDLIFIAHGVGGLIVKDALSTTAVSQVFGKRSELGSIYPRTVGAIFLGTPHEGHGRLTLAECAVLAARLDSVDGRDELDDMFLQMMKESNELLETQRGEFALISRDLPVICVREQVATHSRAAEILPKGCATFDGMNVTTDDFFQDHKGLARYCERQESGYFQLVGHISKLTKRTHFQDTEAGMIRTREILDALHYDMREQENKANENLKQNSAWILSAKDNEGSGAGDNVPGAFDHWLQDSGSPVFWISGNPGSGKTTLMRHAFHDPGTRKLLDRWVQTGVDANTKRRDRPELLMAAVFLFEAGSYVQKSREGILRGVLYQILTQKPEFVPVCFPSFMQGPWPPPVPFNTTVNLSQAFYQLFSRMSKTLRLCMFIDGLDEYRLAEGAQAQQDDPSARGGQSNDYDDSHRGRYNSRSMDDLSNDTATLAVSSEHGETENPSELTSVSDRGEILGNSQWINDSHTEIARLIMDLSNQDHVKLCVASRELPPFERAFAGVPRLRVHTHTEKLISQYCAERLDMVAPGLSGSQRPLCDEVARKSRGDILWARLAIDMLMEGSLRRLMATLESLPSQLGGPNGLYMRIIQSMSPEEQREAARIFHIILRAVDPPNLVTLAFAFEGYMAPPKLQLADPTVGKMLVDHDRAHPYSREDLTAISDRMQARLKASCGDLLETTDKGGRVVFMHLTAKEFVLRSSVWRQAQLPVPSSVDVDVSLMSGTIRYLKCYSTLRLVVTSRPRLQFTPDAWLLVSQILRYASRVDERLINGNGNEECSREVYVALLDELDATFQEAWQTAIKEHVPARDDVSWYRDRYRQLLTSHWTDFEPMELGPSPRRQGFLSLAVQANLYGYVSYKISQMTDDTARASQAMDLLEFALAPEGDSRTVDGGQSLSAAGAVTGTYKDFHHDMPDGRFAPLLIDTVLESQYQQQNLDLAAQQRFVWTQTLKAGRQFFQQRGGRAAILNLTPESATTLARNRGRWVAAIKALLGTGWVDPHMQIQDSNGNRIGELKTATDIIKETLDGEVEFAKELVMIEALIVNIEVTSPRAM